MPWRHVDDKAFNLASGHPLERSGHFLVVCAVNEARPYGMHVLHELYLGFFGLFLAFVLFQQCQNVLSFMLWH